MNMFLKGLRIAISLVFLLATTFLLLDVWHIIPPEWSNRILFMQFVPSLLKFLEVVGFGSIGFLVVVVLTLLFGRIYCSTICPLGIFQDIVHFMKRKSVKRKKLRYKKPLTILRYSVFGIVVLFFLSGFILLVNLLDPYSLYGKIVVHVFKPVLVFLNNFISSLLQSVNIYSLFPIDIQPVQWLALSIGGAFLVLIITLAWRRGRLYCNTICPAGTLLGLLSKLSVFKIRINEATCTRCNQCVQVCKAECINLKKQEIDFSRCVGCLNCIAQCPENAINYHPNALLQPALPDPYATTRNTEAHHYQQHKRHFLKSMLFSVFGLSFVKFLFAEQDTTEQKNTMVPIHRKHYVTPPGSQSFERFNDRCTACHLCVTACPSNVLRPSIWEYGLKGLLQPYLDYHISYCNYKCVTCSEVCPTGAILPITEEEKKTTQMGIANFVKKNCIVYTSNTSCGACSEHCPTKAVKMVPYKEDLSIPKMYPDICIGCGACEYACPTDPKSIYVEAHEVHQTAELPEKGESQKSGDKDKESGDKEEEEFPF